MCVYSANCCSCCGHWCGHGMSHRWEKLASSMSTTCASCVLTWITNRPLNESKTRWVTESAANSRHCVTPVANRWTSAMVGMISCVSNQLIQWVSLYVTRNKFIQLYDMLACILIFQGFVHSIIIKATVIYPPLFNPISILGPWGALRYINSCSQKWFNFNQKPKMPCCWLGTSIELCHASYKVIFSDDWVDRVTLLSSICERGDLYCMLSAW